MKNQLLILAVFIIGLTACQNSINPPADNLESILPTDLPLEKINLPEGWKIALYASNVANARSMSLSPNGTLFVGTRDDGRVFALRDENKDKVADTMFTIMTGGNMPNGVAFRNGDLYVAEVNRILKWTDIESKLGAPGEPEIVYDQYPTEKHHGWKFISFGPDGKLYVPVGAPCNICESTDPVFASITRMNPDGTGMEVVQQGVRNTVGFTWHPVTGDLWFTDNGRDMLGDDIPSCELNHATADNMHFGYPYCHQGDLADPDFGAKRSCDEFTPPAQKLGPHVAPLGVEFYTGSMFPSESLNGKAIIAEHGSWNRSKKIGYRITTVSLNDQYESTGYDVLIDGWLDTEKDEVWGRPVDIEFMPDGSMLISDDFADVIYRVSLKN